MGGGEGGEMGRRRIRRRRIMRRLHERSFTLLHASAAKSMRKYLETMLKKLDDAKKGSGVLGKLIKFTLGGEKVSWFSFSFPVKVRSPTPSHVIENTITSPLRSQAIFSDPNSNLKILEEPFEEEERFSSKSSHQLGRVMGREISVIIPPRSSP